MLARSVIISTNNLLWLLNHHFLQYCSFLKDADRQPVVLFCLMVSAALAASFL
jgi:hypothetical protein